MTKPVRILVVDDYPDIVDLLSEVLRHEGYEVRGAATGMEGLSVARSWHPDLVVLDVMLPDINGVEVCRLIKADAALTDVFVLLASGEATQTAQKVGGLDGGADDYMVKPMQLAEFRARVRTLIRLQQTTVALRLSRENYRQLVDILPEGIWMLDAEGALVAANPQAVAMLGYPNADDLQMKSVFELASPVDGERFRHELEQAATHGVAHDLTCTLVRRDGSRFPAEASIAAVCDTETRARAFVCIVRNMTERRLAESRLRELLHLIDQAHDAIIVRDLPGKIRFFNKGAERLLGWSPDDVHERHVLHLLMDDHAKFDETQQILNQTGEWNGELLVPTKTGEPRTVMSRWTLVRGETDRSSYVVIINTDITARKRAEETLRRREELSQAIIGGAMDGYWLVDLEGNILDVNQAYCQMIGYSAEEILCRKINDLEAIETSNATVRFHLQQIVQTGRDRFETCHRHKDGRLVDVEVSATYLRGQGLCVAFLRDITARNESQKLVCFQRDAALLLGSADDLPESLGRLLSMAQQVNGVDAGAVFLLNSATKKFDLVAHHGWPDGFARRLPCFPLEPGEAKVGQPIYWRHGESPRAMVEPFVRENLRAVELIPIRPGTELMVWLVAGTRTQPELTSQSRLVLESISAQARSSIARLRAESSLHANQQLLEKTFHSIHAAVLVVDTTTDVIMECNPAATRIFGYAREEIMGKTTAFLYPEEVQRTTVRDHLAAAILSQEVNAEFESQMRHKHGTVFPSEHSVTPILDEAGQCRRWVTVVRDITKRKGVEEELRQIPGRILEAQEGERLRVARELHDGVNQTIASAKMRLQKVQESVTSLSPATKEILARCYRLMVQALEENRRIAQNLRPQDLDEFGLVAACRNLCESVRSRSNLVIKCSLASKLQRLPPAMELNLFRIAQEALNNVEKHSHARTVRLRIALKAGLINLEVRDDGRGFDPEVRPPSRAKHCGAGLTNIRERAAAIGGTCEVASTLKRGTVITVRVPCTAVGDSPRQTPQKKRRTK